MMLMLNYDQLKGRNIPEVIFIETVDIQCVFFKGTDVSLTPRVYLI